MSVGPDSVYPGLRGPLGLVVVSGLLGRACACGSPFALRTVGRLVSGPWPCLDFHLFARCVYFLTSFSLDSIDLLIFRCLFC